MKQAILLLVIVICLAGPVFADRLYTWGSPEPISLNATTKTLHAFEGTDFKFNSNGSFDIIKNGVKYGTVFFGLSGTYQGTAYKRLVSDFNWTVQVLENSPEKISVRAYNNYPAFQWWVDLNIGKYEYFKVSHTIKNNMAKQVTNAKLWYVVVIDQNTLPFALYQKSDCLDANCAFVYDYSTDKSYTSLDTNFAQYYNKVSFLTAGQKPISARFLFADLIKNGFFITNAFFGNLSHLDVFLPDANGFALAFSKGAQTIPSGATVVIDPTVTAADALEGHIQYQGASYKAVDATSIIAGHLGASGKYNWYRPILSFDITGLGVVKDANLYLAYASKAIVSETCTFDLNSITTIGAAIDSADWATTTFETTKNNWFDQTIAANISNPVISAWNGAVGASRAYIDFRIGMDNEPTYTGTSNDCQVTFTDIGNAGAQSYISYTLPISVNVVYPNEYICLKSGYTLDLNFTVISFYSAPSLLFDINYSTSSAEGTGVVVLNDANVASTTGFKCDSNTLTTPQICTYSLNTTGLSNGNYYLLVKGISPDNNTSFDSGTDVFEITDASIGAYKWKSIGALPASGGFNVIALDANTLIIGGNFLDANGIGSADYLIAYHLNTKIWQSVGPLPTSPDSLLTIDANKFVVGDGQDINGIAAADYLAMYNFSTNKWTPLNSTWNSTPPPSVNDSVLVDANRMVVVGTFSDLNGIKDLNNVAIFNFNTNTWSSIGGIGSPLIGTIYSVGKIDSNRIIISGIMPDINGISSADNLAMYNFSTNKWASIGRFSNVSYYARSFDMVNSTTLVMGGTFLDFNGISSADDLAIYDFTTNKWSSIGGYNDVSNDIHTVKMLDSTHLMIGGFFGDFNGVGCSRVCIYDFTTNKWSSIGGANDNVYEMALIESGKMAVTGYFSDMNGFSSADGIAIYSDCTCFSSGAPPVSTYDFTVALPASCIGLQGKSTAGNGACDRCWAQPTDSLPPIDSSDLNCQGQNVGSGIPFLLFDFTGSATTYDLNMDLNVAPTTGLSALVKCDSGDSTGAVTLTASPQVVCDGIAGDHNIFMWLKFTNYSVANGLFSTRRADVNASA